MPLLRRLNPLIARSCKYGAPAVLGELRKAREVEKKEKRLLKTLRKLDEPDRMNFRQAQARAAKTAQNRQKPHIDTPDCIVAASGRGR